MKLSCKHQARANQPSVPIVKNVPINDIAATKEYRKPCHAPTEELGIFSSYSGISARILLVSTRPSQKEFQIRFISMLAEPIG